MTFTFGRRYQRSLHTKAEKASASAARFYRQSRSDRLQALGCGSLAHAISSDWSSKEDGARAWTKV